MQQTSVGKSVLNSVRFSPVISPGAIFCNKHFRQTSAEIVAAAVIAYSVDTATEPNRDVKPYEGFKEEIQDILDYIIEHDPNTEAIKHSIPGTLADLCAQWYHLVCKFKNRAISNCAKNSTPAEYPEIVRYNAYRPLQRFCCNGLYRCCGLLFINSTYLQYEQDNIHTYQSCGCYFCLKYSTKSVPQGSLRSHPSDVYPASHERTEHLPMLQ